MTFKDGLNIIIGQNGVGKSNLLEFISESVYWSLSPFAIKERLRALRGAYSYILSQKSAQGLSSIAIKIEKFRANAPDEYDSEVAIALTSTLDGKLLADNINVSALATKDRRQYEQELKQAKPFWVHT